MIPGKTWWIGALVVALCGLAWPARGGGAPVEELRIEALSVPVGADWSRGPAEQEKEDDVYILGRDAGTADALQVMLMRRAPVIKGDAETFYANLTRYWRANYGKAVLIDRLAAGGVDWLYLRRPTRESGVGLFQLSTVFEGRAYSLLVFVPGTMTALSAPAMELLAGMRLGMRKDVAPEPTPEPTLKPTPEPTPNPPTPNPPTPNPPTSEPASLEQTVPVQPAPPPPERWARTRVYRFNLSGEALEAVASADVDYLGEDGMLTGYGLDYGEASVDWFMEGFAWKTVDGRVTRVPWSTRGRLEVEAPAELDGASTWTLRLTLPKGETGISARLAVWDLCGPGEAVRDVLERLDRGARAPMERLAATPWAGCPAPAAFAPSPRLRGEPGKAATATWTLSAAAQPFANPAAAPTNAPAAAPVRLRLVEAVLEPGAQRAVPGDGLLERARLFFAYEPR